MSVGLSIFGTGPALAQDGWTQVGSSIDGVAGSLGGWATALSADGSIVAVGAPYEEVSGQASTGTVRILEWDGSSWTLRGTAINGPAASSLFGASLAISADGNYVAVGATQTSGSAGFARIYSWDSGTSSWQLKGSPVLGTSAGDRFGYAIDISDDGNTVIVGAPNTGVNKNSGEASVYTWNGTAWVLRGSAFTGAVGDLLGVKVSMSADGNTIAYGAIGATGVGANAGEVEVWTWGGSAWAQVGAAIGGTTTNEYFGNAVSLSSDGSVLAVGANNGNGGNGIVRVYGLSGSSWVQRGSTLTGDDPGYFGYSVALSSDGTVVAAGASTANASTGQAVVYTWDGNSWSQRGQAIDGGAVGDVAGFSIALSAAGDIVAVGSERSTTPSAFSGQVRVFAFPTAVTGSIPGPATYFTFLLPDGRECSAISPMQVQVGTMVELPGVDALCQTMPGSSVAGWTIPVPHGFTGYGSSFEPFPPGLRVRVIESQRFTLVPFEPVLQIDYDANIAARDSCVPANLAHTSEDGRVEHVWVPREDHAIARTPAQAPCSPAGYALIGWNTAGDGNGITIAPGAPLPNEWATSPDNHHRLYAMWSSN